MLGNAVMSAPIESRETRDGARVIFTIDITDYTGSNTLKIILEKAKAAQVEAIKNGDTLLVSGEVSFDKYDRELIIRPRDVMLVDKIRKTCPPWTP